MLSLPCIIGDLHGDFGPPMIFDLPPLVDECLGSNIIQTINTFTLVRAHNPSLKTLKQGDNRTEMR
jgi:hypothetical protein